MAHYAADCWDAEIHTTYGWIESVGIADRAAYDLRVHSQKTKEDLYAEEVYDPPRIEDEVVVKVNAGKFGPAYGKNQQIYQDHLKSLSKEDAQKLKAELEKGPATVHVPGNESFVLQPDFVAISFGQKKISVNKFLPGVIEPAFGVGRIMYAILEHSYCVRVKAGAEEGMLQLRPLIAPVKCALLPISSAPDAMAIVQQLEQAFVRVNLATKTDTSGASIGRKYARADEIGVPFGIAIDFESPKDGAVTIRDRDTTQQIRVPVAKAPSIVHELCLAKSTWEAVYAKYPKFGGAE